MINEIRQKTIFLDYVNIPQGDLDLDTEYINDNSDIIEDDKRYRVFIPESLNFQYIKDENESLRIKKQSDTPESLYSAKTYDTEKELEIKLEDNIELLYKAEKEV
jgi:hypothetical protein